MNDINKTVTTVTTVTEEVTGTVTGTQQMLAQPTPGNFAGTQQVLAQPTPGNFASYIGHPITLVETSLLGAWPGVVVIKPGEVITMDRKLSRLQVYVDDQGIITRIVNG